MKDEFTIKIPFEAQRIIDVLKSKGHEGYVVGGCVRDSLMGRSPYDWDITTNAEPKQMEVYFSCFDKVIPTGIKHGTLTVIVDGKSFEVTTFRIDGKYSDGRRPDDVVFTKSLKEDLARRDFTINAMAYSQDKGLIDYFGGVKSIQGKEIKCVGDPDGRFREDALRMLRAVRFAAQLNFTIEEETGAAIQRNSHTLSRVSVERINQEFSKMIISNPYSIKELWKLKLIDHIIPEFNQCMITEQDNPYHVYNVGEHILKSMESIEPMLHLRLAMLLHDIGKPEKKTIDDRGIGHFYGHQERSAEMARDILKRLKYDNATIEMVCQLVLLHDRTITTGKKCVRKWLNKLGKDRLMDLIKVKDADSKAQNAVYYESRHLMHEQIKASIEEILHKNECFTVKDLKINGYELIAAGYKQGKEIGDILRMLLGKVLENPELNEKEKLLELAYDFKKLGKKY